MRIYEKNRFRMAQALLNFLKNSPPAVLLLLPLLSSLTTALELIVNAIIAAEQTQITVALGEGSGKKAKKTALVNIAESVGKAIKSFAGNTSNVELQATMKTLLDKMDRQADTILLARCRAIYDNCEKYGAELFPVGVTDEVRDILAGSISDYENIGSVLRNRIAERKEAGAMIALLLKDAIRLMTEQIDPLVRSLRGQDEYVRMYDTNRTVINIGHRYTQFTGVSTVKDTNEHLMNVEIEFRSATGSVTDKTDVNGKYKEKIHPDVYDIIATHPLYETFIIEGVEIRAGEIKVVNMELVPKG